MQPLRKLDSFLNNITTYRLLLYGLFGLAVLSIVFCFTGVLSFSGLGMLISFTSLFTVCFVVNWLVGRYWPAITNAESCFITALILGFILPQATSVSRWLAIVLTGVLAMATKYLLAIYAKHLFNPAAAAAVIVAVAGLLPATWWVGTPALLPFTLILGFAILRKLRRFEMFAAFALAALIVTALVAMVHGDPVAEALQQAVASAPLIFLGTVMLTEPSTTPPRTYHQVAYGILVGAIFTSQLHAGGLASTPEMALVIGNLFSYAVSPKYKFRLSLKQRIPLAKNVYEFVFTPDRPLKFLPGQYLEWTLAVPNTDMRGNRRSFTIASSPTEKEVRLGIKTYTPSSRFKTELLAMEPGGLIMGGQLGGNFVMPASPTQKMVWVAGGIGITPFRSMAKYLADTKTVRDAVLFYLVADPEELSFQEVFDAAKQFGVTLVPVLSRKPNSKAKALAMWRGETGGLSVKLLQKYVPDYKSRTFYLSGPDAMVHLYEDLLHAQGIPRRAVKKDYFSGY